MYMGFIAMLSYLVFSWSISLRFYTANYSFCYRNKVSKTIVALVWRILVQVYTLLSGPCLFDIQSSSVTGGPKAATHASAYMKNWHYLLCVPRAMALTGSRIPTPVKFAGILFLGKTIPTNPSAALNTGPVSQLSTSRLGLILFLFALTISSS